MPETARNLKVRICRPLVLENGVALQAAWTACLEHELDVARAIARKDLDFQTTRDFWDQNGEALAHVLRFKTWVEQVSGQTFSNLNRPLPNSHAGQAQLASFSNHTTGVSSPVIGPFASLAIRPLGVVIHELGSDWDECLSRSLSSISVCVGPRGSIWQAVSSFDSYVEHVPSSEDY